MKVYAWGMQEAAARDRYGSSEMGSSSSLWVC